MDLIRLSPFGLGRVSPSQRCAFRSGVKKMAEWLPIDTAPKDAEVIVFAPGESPPIFTASADDLGMGTEWFRQSGGIAAARDDYFGDPPFKPTHWMPLPQPPQAEEHDA
jgi:hypothetical protein